MKDPDAENVSDKLWWSNDEADVEAGGEDPPLPRTLAPMGD